MLTYGLAQLFITEGAVKYINSKKNLNEFRTVTKN